MEIRRDSAVSILSATFFNLLVFIIDQVYVVSAWITYSLTLLLQLYLFKNFDTKRPLVLILFVAGLVLYAFPYLGEIFRRGSPWPLFYSLYLLASVILIEIDARTALRNEEFYSVGRWSLVIILVSLMIAVFGLHFWDPVLPAFYGIALIHLDRLCLSDGLQRRKVLVGAAAFYIALLYYMLFVWSGFGRLNFLTFLILPLIVLVSRKVVSLNKWLLIMLVPIGLIYGSALRGVNTISAENFAEGSSSHHLVLMQDLLNNSDRIFTNLYGLWDQFLLFFLNWFPREIWGQKPIGIGSSFVDTYIGREGFGEAHSVSLGFWGEHIYLNPRFWFVSGFALVLLVAFCSRIVYRLSFGSMPVLLMFQANFLTLFWGGMASFGSRVWWMVIPSVLYLWVERSFRKSV